MCEQSLLRRQVSVHFSRELLLRFRTTGQRKHYTMSGNLVFAAERKNSAAESSRPSLGQDTSHRQAVADQPEEAPVATDGSQPPDTVTPTDATAFANEFANVASEQVQASADAAKDEEEPENTDPQDEEQQTEDPAESTFCDILNGLVFVLFLVTRQLYGWAQSPSCGIHTLCCILDNDIATGPAPILSKLLHICPNNMTTCSPDGSDGLGSHVCIVLCRTRKYLCTRNPFLHLVG